MNNLTEKLSSRFNFKWGNAIPLAAAIVLTVLIFLNTALANYILWTSLSILLTIVVAGILFRAGFTVLRSFFYLGAEISLLIFLSEAYCSAVPVASPVHDGAMRALVILAVVYIAYEFLKSLKEALTEGLKNIPEKRRKWERIIRVTLFSAAVLVIIFALYEVIGPIIKNICVYHR